MIVFLREMLSLLQPGESVAKALRRLGGGNKVGGKNQGCGSRSAFLFSPGSGYKREKLKNNYKRKAKKLVYR